LLEEVKYIAETIESIEVASTDVLRVFDVEVDNLQ